MNMDELKAAYYKLTKHMNLQNSQGFLLYLILRELDRLNKNLEREQK